MYCVTSLEKLNFINNVITVIIFAMILLPYFFIMLKLYESKRKIGAWQNQTQNLKTELRLAAQVSYFQNIFLLYPNDNLFKMFIVAAALVVNKIFYYMAANYSTEPWFNISSHVTTLGITSLTSLSTLIFNGKVKAEVVVLFKPKKKTTVIIVAGTAHWVIFVIIVIELSRLWLEQILSSKLNWEYFVPKSLLEQTIQPLHLISEIENKMANKNKLKIIFSTKIMFLNNWILKKFFELERIDRFDQTKLRCDLKW